MQFHEGELGRTIDGDEQVEPAFGRVNLGQIDMEVAERIGLEAFYEGWTLRGRPKKVAFVAVMRKLLVRLNATVRDPTTRRSITA